MQRKRCKIFETCEESSYFNLAACADYFTFWKNNQRMSLKIFFNYPSPRHYKRL